MAALALVAHPCLSNHPGVELRAILKSIFDRCHLFKLAFVWELTEETIHLPIPWVVARVVKKEHMRLFRMEIIVSTPLSELPRVFLPGFAPRSDTLSDGPLLCSYGTIYRRGD